MSTSMTRDRALSKRGGSNVWAGDERVIDAWRRGSPEEVPPLSCEYAPILSCHARCPACPYHDTRQANCDDIIPLGRLAPMDDEGASTAETARRVIERCVEAGIRGMLFTGGGEPTIWPALVEMLRYSGRLGMTNGLYTNGFQLGFDRELADRLLAPETCLAFVRISMNTAAPRPTQQHWGLKDAEKILEAQELALDRLLQARRDRLPQYQAWQRTVPALSVSTIVGEREAVDLWAVCQKVAGIFGGRPEVRTAEDVMVVRPITDHRRAVYSTEDRDEAVIRTILETCGAAGDGRRALESAGVRLDLGFGLDRVARGELPGYSDVLREQYALRDCCWAHGLFLTVGPDASVYPCTEMNCDPAWSIGNLKTQSVEEIYRGRRRRDMLRLAQSIRWGPQLFQPQGRTARLDAIAKAIMTGELVDEDIEAIRQASLSSHSLMLN